MEVYHVNAGGPGFFTLSMEVPNLDSAIERWQSFEVHQLQINYTNGPEIIDFNSKGVSSGNILLRVYRTAGDSVIDVSAIIPWNANATQFCNALDNFYWFQLSTLGISCTLTMKDSTGALTTQITSAVEFTWRVTIEKLRTDKGYDFTVTYSAGAGSFSKIPIQ